ncbi:proteasome alpha type [Populus alba x Populus x berolinensis]|nr:proteasome alpha type [Populus alba x Populus x berolinensis]
MSGLIADALTLVAMPVATQEFSYGEPMTVESTTASLLSDLAPAICLVHYLGFHLLIAGHDEKGPSLSIWHILAVQCKGYWFRVRRCRHTLQEQYNKDLTLKEAETIALSILKQVMEEKVTPNNVDIAKVAPVYHLYTPAEVEEVISRL